MKKFQKIFIIPVLFVCAMLALAGCEFSFGGNTAKVSSIELTSAVETAYNIGDTFDAKDAQIRVKYDDDTTKIVDIVASTMISGFDTTKTGNRICVLTYSKKIIEISYSVINTITFGKYYTSAQQNYYQGQKVGDQTTYEKSTSYILLSADGTIKSYNGTSVVGTGTWKFTSNGDISVDFVYSGVDSHAYMTLTYISATTITGTQTLTGQSDVDQVVATMTYFE